MTRTKVGNCIWSCLRAGPFLGRYNGGNDKTAMSPRLPRSDVALGAMAPTSFFVIHSGSFLRLRGRVSIQLLRI
jgi:hypothetical protein